MNLVKVYDKTELSLKPVRVLNLSLNSVNELVEVLCTIDAEAEVSLICGPSEVVTEIQSSLPRAAVLRAVFTVALETEHLDKGGNVSEEDDNTSPPGQSVSPLKEDDNASPSISPLLTTEIADLCHHLEVVCDSNPDIFQTDFIYVVIEMLRFVQRYSMDIDKSISLIKSSMEIHLKNNNKFTPEMQFLISTITSDLVNTLILIETRKLTLTHTFKGCFPMLCS